MEKNFNTVYSVPVIICDAETRSALAAFRSLVTLGVPVIIASHKQNALSFSSRYAKSHVQYPSPGTNRSVFIERMVSLLKEYPGALCMTFTDTTTDALVDGISRRILPSTCLLTPTKDVFDRVTDKRILTKEMHALGIPVPPEVSQNGIITFPIIIKPARSVSWHGDRAFKDTARVVDSKESFDAVIQYFETHTDRAPLIQSMIKGEEYGLSVLAHHGTIVTLFAHRRLRSITAHGGASALRESVALTDEMHDIARKIVTAYAWHGVMMIELKRNEITGQLTLIEVNARFWGSLYLAIVSGINFPYLLYQMHIGETLVQQYPSYRVGIRARHLIGDMSHFYSLRRRAFSFSSFLAFFTFFQKGLYYDVWSWRDPLPGVVELFQYIKKKL